MKLAFLRRCRSLKRPPRTKRVKCPKNTRQQTLIEITTFGDALLLRDAIVDQNKELCRLQKLLKQSRNTRELNQTNNNVNASQIQSHFDKKFHWLQIENSKKWSAWPKKHFNPNLERVNHPSRKNDICPNKNKNMTKSNPSRARFQNNDTSYKPGHSNSENKIRRHRKRINKENKMANDPVNTAVFNLSDEPVPPEVFTLLSKRMGFVPTTKHDPLSMRNDCHRTMANLAMITKSKIDKTNFNNEPLPKSLKREKHLLVEKSGDSVIDQIIPEVIKEVCLSLDAKVKDNLNPAEKKGMNWLIKQVTYGDLRAIKADKG